MITDRKMYIKEITEGKPVIAYFKKTGEVINEYPSLKKCAQELLLNGQKAKNLQKHLNGECKSSYSKVLKERFFIKLKQ